MDNLVELIITRSCVESIAQQEITSLTVGFSWRNTLGRQPRKLIQVGLIQLIGLSIIFMLGMLPIDRVLMRSHPSSSNIER